MVGAVARLVDRQRLPKKWLCLGVPSFGVQEHTKVIHQSRGRLADFRAGCMLDHHSHMRRE